jgi:deoxyribose-phosphate aldolase
MNIMNISNRILSENENQKNLSMEQIFSKNCIPPETLAVISKTIDKHIIELNDNINNYADLNITSMIDHTLLKANASVHDIKRLCDEAIQYKFYSVCVNPVYVTLCRELLDGTNIKICTVVGFPLGTNTSAAKAFEAKDAESNGADEIDMVIDIGAIKDRKLEHVKKDITSVVNATSKVLITKVILENAYLTLEEKILGCLLAMDAGADFVKTSTGFGPSGATIKDVALMRYVVGNKMGVKAAGSIRDRLTALKMIKAGANRIGTSSSVRIIAET